MQYIFQESKGIISTKFRVEAPLAEKKQRYEIKNGVQELPDFMFIPSIRISGSTYIHTDVHFIIFDTI